MANSLTANTANSVNAFYTHAQNITNYAKLRKCFRIRKKNQNREENNSDDIRCDIEAIILCPKKKWTTQLVAITL